MTAISAAAPMSGPGATLAGKVTVGAGAFVGAGATVVPGITIGDGATVGAGAVVIRDVPTHTVVAGVPARVSEIVSQDMSCPASAPHTHRRAGAWRK